MKHTYSKLTKDTLVELFSFDEKVVSSFKQLLFFPGSLTNEFIHGDKERYSLPTRLIFSIIAFYSIIIYLFRFIPVDKIRLKDDIYLKVQFAVDTLPLVAILVIAPFLVIVLNIVLRKIGSPETNLVFSLHLVAFFYLGLLLSAPFIGDILYVVYVYYFVKHKYINLFHSKTERVVFYSSLVLSVIPFIGEVFYVIQVIFIFLFISRQYENKFTVSTKIINIIMCVITALPFIGEIFSSYYLYLLVSMLEVYDSNINKIAIRYAIIVFAFAGLIGGLGFCVYKYFQHT